VELKNVTKAFSPEREGFSRLSADVFFEKTGKTRNYWIEFPAEHHDEISTSGNCWLILLSAMAALNGETVKIELPVDPYLLENIKALRREWRALNKRWMITGFDCPNLKPLERSGQRTGAFFSGGIDSFYTLLRNDKEPNDEGDATGSIDDLITVWGFDIPLDMPEEFAHLEEIIKNTARVFRKKHIVAITNIRSFDDDFSGIWIPVGHSGSLGFVAYALQKRFREIVIGSTVPYGKLKPFGSHSLTEGLMSSKALRVLHDGAIADRAEKTRRVAMSDEALEIMHVCIRKEHEKNGGPAQLNCSACEKCVLTMAMLDIHGKKGKPANFDWSKYSIAAVESQFVRPGPLLYLWTELRETAREHNRPDIASAVTKAIRRSQPFWIANFIERLIRKYFPLVTKNKKTFRKIKKAFYALFGMVA